MVSPPLTKHIRSCSSAAALWIKDIKLNMADGTKYEGFYMKPNKVQDFMLCQISVFSRLFENGAQQRQLSRGHIAEGLSL